MDWDLTEDQRLVRDMVREFVDAFAAGPFTGNPAAVCLLDAPRDEAWMQAVAAEMNLSETAFLLPPSTNGADYRVRIFTPAGELPFEHLTVDDGLAHPSVWTIHQDSRGFIWIALAAQMSLNGLAPW